MKDEKDTNKNRKPARKARVLPTVSAIDRDGQIIEMIRDRQTGATSFCIGKGSKWEIQPRVRLRSGSVFAPLSPENNLLSHKVVLFASSPLEYGNTASLITLIRGYLHRYVDLDPAFERLASYYVLLSWLYDGYREIPYLRVKGEPGCGKTRFLQVVGSICYKPIFASGASTVSPLFRILDLVRGTVVLDEADFRFSDERAEVVKILNNGTMRDFPVLRTEVASNGREFNPRAYHVFGPKLIATRGPFQDRALETRCLTEQMGIGPLRGDVPISLSDRYEEEAAELRDRLLLFRLRNWRRVTLGEDVVRRSLDPRLNQMFAPLLSVVEDPEDRRELETLATGYQRDMLEDRSQAVEGLVVQAIYHIYQQEKGSPTVLKIAQALVPALGSTNDKVSARWVGHILRGRLGIRTQRRSDGYAIAPSEAKRLTTLFERYGLSDRPEDSLHVPQDVHDVHDVHNPSISGTMENAV